MPLVAGRDLPAFRQDSNRFEVVAWLLIQELGVLSLPQERSNVRNHKF